MLTSPDYLDRLLNYKISPSHFGSNVDVSQTNMLNYLCQLALVNDTNYKKTNRAVNKNIN